MKAIQAGLVAGLIVCGGCATVKRERNAVPQNLVSEAIIPGIPNARYWGDDISDSYNELLKKSPEELNLMFSGIIDKPHAYIGISGGGANGAYGAGVLAGWSASGKRPEFTVVTGTSTGSIIAPFAFLGSDYDNVLKTLYSEKSTEDVLNDRRLLKGLRSDALSELDPLRELLSGYLGDPEIEAIAEEYRIGRRLFIGTVNMDALRPVTWNIGEIAASGSPGARDLILDIIIASTSIPVAFPPVFIDVEAEGQTFQEMHVDGGLAAQVFVYPATLEWEQVRARIKPAGTPQVYVIRNAKLDPKWEVVDAKLIPLAARSLDSLIRTQGIGDLEEIALSTQRDKLDFHLAYIPASFDEKANEAFDPVYMSKLFDLGFQSTLDGTAWRSKIGN